MISGTPFSYFGFLVNIRRTAIGFQALLLRISLLLRLKAVIRTNKRLSEALIMGMTMHICMYIHTYTHQPHSIYYMQDKHEGTFLYFYTFYIHFIVSRDFVIVENIFTSGLSARLNS